MKLLLFPPCTPTGANGSLCTVDGWSIAGLAATVLGVAAAILTILGAFSVAYWWAELDKRVNKQVTQLFNEQKTALNDEVDDLLQQQKKKVNDLLQTQTERIEDQGRQVDKTKRDLEQMREQIDSIINLTFSVASVNPPWVLEEWAKDITQLSLKHPKQQNRWCSVTFRSWMDCFQNGLLSSVGIHKSFAISVLLPLTSSTTGKRRLSGSMLLLSIIRAL